MTIQKKRIIGGISVLSVAGIICKLIGVLYKIPLANTIGPMGMGVYHQVFPTYNLLLAVSSAGFPVAISRTVAAACAKGDRDGAKTIFRTALLMLAAAGLVGTLLIFGSSGWLSRMKNTPDCRTTYLAIAPSLFLVCVMSAYRGFAQGRMNMVPTAVSQLIEQVGKVLVAIPFAAVGMRQGGFVRGAAGAMLGTSVAELLALIYMMANERLHRKAFEAMGQQGASEVTGRSAAKELLAIALPVTIGACIVPIAAEIDSFMLVGLMTRYMAAGEAVIQYGMYTGLVFPLINVPTALAMAAAAAMVPAISRAAVRQDKRSISESANIGLQFSVLVGLPASIGMSMLAHPILTVLFGRGQYSAAQLGEAASLLEISALTVLWFTLVQSTSGILQGLKKQNIPMYTLIAGVVMKIALNYTLVRIPGINIHGAPFASILCYVVSFAPNLYYCVKFGGMKLNVRQLVMKPALATAAMALAILLMKHILGRRVYSLMGLGLAMAAAMAVYAAAAFAVGAVSPAMLPARLKRRKG